MGIFRDGVQPEAQEWKAELTLVVAEKKVKLVYIIVHSKA